MNSHIQIPKCVFREFALINNGFFKYGITSKKITPGYPKSTFTEENYYSETTEKLLNKHVETPLKKLLSFAHQLPSQSLPIILNSEIREIALTYAKSLIARSPTLCQSLVSHSIFGQFLSKRDQHDYCVASAMSNEKMIELFDKFDLSFIINLADTPLVLATRGLYDFTINGIISMISPLNPYCGLFFIEKGKNIHNKVTSDQDIVFIPTGYDDVVMKMNSFALIRQKNDGNGYIVSHNKSILESLIT